MRTLRRRVLIREKDFNEKLRTRAIGHDMYHRANWEPLTYLGLEQENVLNILKHPETALNYANPELYLHYNKEFLYNERYLQWHITRHFITDEVLITPKNANGVTSSLGWAVLERDY